MKDLNMNTLLPNNPLWCGAPKLAVFSTPYQALLSVLIKHPRRERIHSDQTPPNRTSTPANPNIFRILRFIAESKREDITHILATRFVDSSFEIVRDKIGIIPWLDAAHFRTIMLRCHVPSLTCFIYT